MSAQTVLASASDPDWVSDHYWVEPMRGSTGRLVGYSVHHYAAPAKPVGRFRIGAKGWGWALLRANRKCDKLNAKGKAS